MYQLSSLLLIFFITACSSFDANTYAPVPGGDNYTYNQVYVGNSDITNLFLRAEFDYNVGNYLSIEKKCIDYGYNDDIEKNYVLNLLAHIKTFDLPDIDRAININESIFFNINKEQFYYKLDIDKRIKVRNYQNATGKGILLLLAPAIIVVAGIEDATEGTTTLSDISKGYSEFDSVEWQYTDFTKNFVFLNLKTIKINCAKRLIYLYDLVFDDKSVELWKDRLKKLYGKYY